jgi:hypothetical protein
LRTATTGYTTRTQSAASVLLYRMPARQRRQNMTYSPAHIALAGKQETKNGSDYPEHEADQSPEHILTRHTGQIDRRRVGLEPQMSDSHSTDLPPEIVANDGPELDFADMGGHIETSETK